MNFYLKLIRRIIIFNASSFFAFRSIVINSLLSGTVWSISTLVSTLLLTSKARSVYGWSQNELILLTGTFTLTWGLSNLLFQRNFQDLALLIDRGKLDGILLKPVDSQFFVSFRQINYAGVARLIIGSIIVSVICGRLHITIPIISLVIYIFLIILGVSIIYGIWFMIITILVWHHSLTNLNAVANNLIGLSKYPQEMFQRLSPSLVLVFPLLLTATIPTRYILGKSSLGELIFLSLMSIVVVWLSRKFWKFALRYYTSAGG